MTEYTLEQLKAERARRRAPQYTLEQLKAERARRDAPATTEPAPQQPSALGQSLSIMANDLNAGIQGVNPVSVAKATPVGSVLRGADDEIIAIDVDGVREDPANYPGDRYATQIDPQTGLELVYLRTPEIEATKAESAGRVLGYGLPTALPTKAATAPSAALRARKAAEALGVEPSLGMRGPGTARVAGALESNALTAGPIVRDSNRAAAEMARVAEGLADSVGPGVSQAHGGAAIRRGAVEFSDAFKAKEDLLWKAVDRAIPEGAKIEMRSTAGLLDETLRTFEATPEIAKAAGVSQLRGWASDILANGGNLSWDQVKALRSEVGEAIGKMRGPFADQAGGRLKQIYASLTDDMEAGAKALGADQAWKRATRYTRAGKTRIEEALDIVFKGNRSDEAIYDAVVKLGSAKGGRANLAKLMQIKKTMPAEQWSSFVGTVIRRMGMPTAGAVEDGFSAASFLTEWRKLDPAAKRALFNGPGVPNGLARALDQLAEVAGAAKTAGVELNRSRSGAVVGNMATGATIGGGVMGGDPLMTVLGAGAAHLTAQALSQPRFVRALTAAGRGTLAPMQRIAAGRGTTAIQAANVLRLLKQTGPTSGQ